MSNRILPLSDIIRTLPRAMHMGGYIDVRNLTDEEINALQSRAEEVIDDGLEGIHAIGDALFWATRGDGEDSVAEFAAGLGKALQMLTQAIQAAIHVEDACYCVKQGILTWEDRP